MSFSIAEEELQNMNLNDMAGDYATWNYFQSVDQPENKEFINRYRARFGASRVTDDPIVSAYFGVHLWAQAVEEGQSDAVENIRERMKDQSYQSPAGIVYVDATTRHTWKPVRIGRIREDGQFDIIWSSNHAVRPIPFPAYRPRAKWESFLNQLYMDWGQKWANPGK
jgi:urea transport system substrate-binding protein